MALYAYEAFNHSGKKVSGTVDAASSKEVRDKLIKSGLLPSSIARVDAKAATGLLDLVKGYFQPSISRQDIIFFTKQLSVLLKAGIPIPQALELLIEQTEKTLQKMIITLKDFVKEGKTLAEGLEKYPATFDTTYIQLVRAGEASGKLEVVLDRLVVYLERSQELSKKIRDAMRMPLIQLGIVTIIVFVLLNLVVPQIAGVFATQNVTLPLTTRILVALSHVMQHYYLLIIALFIAFSALFLWWKSTSSGKRLWDTLLLKIPMIGYFVRTHAVVQFCSTLGMLVESGVNLPEALAIVCSIIDNSILVDTLRNAREKIIKQGKITIYLKEAGLFPPLAIYLIRTGEESDQLAQMLLTVAQTFDSELREQADGLSSLLNPIMMLIMGGIVGFIVMAIGTPIMQMGDVAAASVKGFGS